MRIVLDMNLSVQWLIVSRAAEFEARHWSEIGDPSDPDATILQWARENHHIVFTHDLDFGAILARSRWQSPSVIQIRGQEVMPAVIGTAVIGVLRKYEEPPLNGALITIDERSQRVRMLPILGRD